MSKQRSFKELAQFANQDLLARRTMRDWAEQAKREVAALNSRCGNKIQFQLDTENPYQTGIDECATDALSPQELVALVGTAGNPSHWATPGREPLRLWQD
jgi:hypothetical protein